MWLTGDMYSNKDDAEEPDWVKTEREQFSTFRDKNKDGQMDRDEVKDWIIPDDYDHASAEAKHLIFESDVNRVCLRQFKVSIFYNYSYKDTTKTRARCTLSDWHTGMTLN